MLNQKLIHCVSNYTLNITLNFIRVTRSNIQAKRWGIYQSVCSLNFTLYARVLQYRFVIHSCCCCCLHWTPYTHRKKSTEQILLTYWTEFYFLLFSAQPPTFINSDCSKPILMTKLISSEAFYGVHHYSIQVVHEH